mgnify:FL=1
MSTLKVDTYLTRGGASEIAIDKIKGVTAAGSMLVVGEGGTNTTNLQQGLAKAWVNFNGASFATNDSFNVGSMTDHGAGTYTVTYSTNFGNANNSPVTCAGGDGYTDRLLTIDSITTSTVKMIENTTDNTQDVGIGTVHTLGDLA